MSAGCSTKCFVKEYKERCDKHSMSQCKTCGHIWDGDSQCVCLQTKSNKVKIIFFNLIKIVHMSLHHYYIIIKLLP